MDPLRSPRTLAQPLSRPAFRPVVCLDQGLTHGADVTAVAGPGVDAAVDEHILALAAAAVDHGAQPAPLTVDLTGCAHLRTIPTTVATLIERHQIAPGDLGVKLAADRAMADTEETGRVFSALRALGCPVGVAEVGSSLGSLRLLAILEMDFAEVAPELVAGMLQGPDSLCEMEAVLRRIDEAGLVSVAAGVANHDQAQWLRDLRCQHGHGLYFGEPSHWLAPSTVHHCQAR